MDQAWDVIVVGAGPAGSTAAALLAREGHRVCVIERETFPRFRIGESLLPACMPVLERLGIPTPADTFVCKRGAEFLCEETGQRHRFGFAEALPGLPEHAWHVERPKFDVLLRDQAIEDGAEVVHGQPVVDVRFDDDLARVRTAERSYAARYLIDASGQGRFLARRMDGVREVDRFGATSVWTHFDQVDDNLHATLGPNYEVRILICPNGWGWVIPLPKDRLSIGLVSQDKLGPEDLQVMLDAPFCSELTAGARRLGTEQTGNYSYENEAPFGPRYGTVGDASSFIDPVFSTGVTLALRGAEALADVLAPALREGREADPELMARHRASMDRAHRTFAGLIHRFYHTNFTHSFLLDAMPDFSMRRGVMSVLAGDVWRDDNPYQELLLKARGKRARGATKGA